MKNIIISLTILMTAILVSCSDELDKSSNVPGNQSSEKEGNVIIQPRNPNLPKIKPFDINKLQTKIYQVKQETLTHFLGELIILKMEITFWEILVMSVIR